MFLSVFCTRGTDLRSIRHRYGVPPSPLKCFIPMSCMYKSMHVQACLVLFTVASVPAALCRCAPKVQIVFFPRGLRNNISHTSAAVTNQRLAGHRAEVGEMRDHEGTTPWRGVGSECKAQGDQLTTLCWRRFARYDRALAGHLSSPRVEFRAFPSRHVGRRCLHEARVHV